MDRRKALKNIGLSMGFITVTPGVLSLLQSCQQETSNWIPDFFNEEEGAIIVSLVDIILPETDTPSASQVNVPQFIDTFANEVMPEDERELMRKTFQTFIQKALSASGKSSAAKLKPKDLETVLASSLKKSKEEQEAIQERFGEYVEAIKNNTEATISDDDLVFVFLSNLRGITIWGYKTSEMVGENVLAYAPVPGQQKGCISVAEATGGKAWAL